MSVPENDPADFAPAPAPSEIVGSSQALTPTALGLLVFINVLWGASTSATKYGLAVFGPSTLALLRFLPSGLLLYALCRRQHIAVPIRRPDRLPLFLLALIGITLTYSVLYIGIARTTATDASLLFACEPLLIALMATLFLGERLRVVQWIGLLVGIVGIRLIAGNGLGNWIALLALAFECSMSVIAKRLTGRYPGLLVVAWELMLGGLFLLPLSLWEIAHHLPTVTVPALLGLAYLTLVCTTLCYGIWYWLLERFPISAMGVFILVQPLSGPLFGWLLRGESLRASSAFGGALVIAGIILTTLIRKNRKRQELQD